MDDHPDPVPELRRLVNLYESYALVETEDEVTDAVRYAEARRRAPEAYELVFWMGIEHLRRGATEAARRELRIAFEADSRWHTTLQHLVDARWENLTPELVATLDD